MYEYLLIPNERVKIVKGSKVVGKLEDSLQVKLKITDNSVQIEGESLELFQAKHIVKAIGRGFSADDAFKLLDENEQLEIIELKGFKENKIKTIKSRVIGTNGKTRKIIEKSSGAVLSIYGNTISIIGTYEQLEKAGYAIKMIIRGSKHANVYRFLRL